LTQPSPPDEEENGGDCCIDSKDDEGGQPGLHHFIEDEHEEGGEHAEGEQSYGSSSGYDAYPGAGLFGFVGHLDPGEFYLIPDELRGLRGQLPEQLTEGALA
jgi:hypothetical protein